MFMSKRATTGNLQSQVMEALLSCLDRLLVISERHEGLLPSVMDARTGQIFDTPPAPITGQRAGDRASRGCNLMHDIPLLRTATQLGQAVDRQDYIDMFERYLSRFAQYCTNTPSGLFPWGEHAYWRLDLNEVGSSHQDVGTDPTYPVIHDHLRAAPVWLWEKLNAYNPQCVQRFALGLDFHFKTGLPLEYSRHACLMAGDACLSDHAGYEQSGRPRRMLRAQDGANDFPRHSGFYAVDIAFAWSKSGNPKLKTLLKRVVDYWWELKDDKGALPLQSRGPDCPRLVPQSLSLAISLYEVASILKQGVYSDNMLSDQLIRRANHYIDLCFMDGCNPDWEILQAGGGNVWGGEYGHAKLTVNRYPCLYLGLYRLTGQARLLDTALMLGRQMAAAPIPTSPNLHLPAMDTAMILGAYCDLYELTRDQIWHDHALHLSQHILNTYFQNALPVGASGIDWYESQLGSSYLIHAMARLCYLLQSPDDCPVQPDYTNR